MRATALRRNVTYSTLSNWFRFVTMGVVPFALLVFFNAKIFHALKRRRQRRTMSQATNMTSTVRARWAKGGGGGADGGPVAAAGALGQDGERLLHY